MHRNIPKRSDFFKQLRAIAINLGLLVIYLTLIGVYYPIFYTNMQAITEEAAENAKKGLPDRTASESLNLLFWLFLSCLMSILAMWMWYFGLYVRNMYRELRAYPLAKRPVVPNEFAVGWSTSHGARLLASSYGALIEETCGEA